MSRDELVALMERERISYPDQLEAERYAPDPEPVDRVGGSITHKRAAHNRSVLARAVKGLED